MKTVRQAGRNAAPRHLFERRREGLAGLLVVAAHRNLQQQVKRRGVRKLGLRAKAAIARIELAQRRPGNLVHQRQRQICRRRRKSSRCARWPPSRCPPSPAPRRAARATPAPWPSARAPKPGPPIAIFARNIRAAKVRPPIGSQKRGQRPSALPADRGDRGLVARIHIGPLVAIHLHRDKMLVDELPRPRGPRTTRGPSRGTSGTTPRQCPAESACPPPARAQTPPRPTDATSPADAAPSADKTTPRSQAGWSRN